MSGGRANSAADLVDEVGEQLADFENQADEIGHFDAPVRRFLVRLIRLTLVDLDVVEIGDDVDVHGQLLVESGLRCSAADLVDEVGEQLADFENQADEIGHFDAPVRRFLVRLIRLTLVDLDVVEIGDDVDVHGQLLVESGLRCSAADLVDEVGQQIAEIQPFQDDFKQFRHVKDSGSEV